MLGVNCALPNPGIDPSSVACDLRLIADVELASADLCVYIDGEAWLTVLV